jgi:hypothetical protein
MADRKVERCRRGSAHAAHGTCPGRDVCVKCRRLAWLDEMVKITELRAHLGKYRHHGCRF